MGSRGVARRFLRRVTCRERTGLRRLGTRSDQAGILLAAASVPGTFQRTLMDRSAVDQGIATGIVAAMSHAIGALVQDAVDVVAFHVSGAKVHREQDDARWRLASLGVGAAVAGAGWALRTRLAERPDEGTGRAVARTAGGWVAAGATAGLAVGALQGALHALDARRRRDRDLRSFPVALPAGAAVAAALELRRHRREVASGADVQVSVGRAVGVGTGTAIALRWLAHGERALATGIGHGLARLFPGHARLWRPVGHAAALAAMAGAVVETMRRVDETIEKKASRPEPAFDEPPQSSSVSGGPGSHVPFSTLSKQGRRNVVTALSTEEIEEVMGEPATAEPIRVFVGLDSAPTPEERVRLAMEELERTGAFDRRLLMVISPTGTGYVNYVTVEAAEFMTLGDCASVTLQYSKRPSVLSLDRVPLQKRQYRMLVEQIHAALESRSKRKRPRVVLFGESLGAWTSEDSFQGEGTQGLVDLGVDRALWIGTPHETRWKDEVLGDGRADGVDPALVAAFNDFGELEALSKTKRGKLRYVMITHDNDAVAKFGLSLLVRRPTWLGDQATRPASVPPTERWSSPTTFVLTLIDMKNAANVVAGRFEAKGHDYRADLARFVRQVYGLTCTDEQLERVEAALRQDELARKERIDERDKKRR